MPLRRRLVVTGGRRNTPDAFSQPEDGSVPTSDTAVPFFECQAQSTSAPRWLREECGRLEWAAWQSLILKPFEHNI